MWGLTDPKSKRALAQAPLAQAQAQVQAHVQDQVTEPPQSTPHEPAAHVDAVLEDLAATNSTTDCPLLITGDCRHGLSGKKDGGCKF